jgi:hypothetical protein
VKLVEAQAAGSASTFSFSSPADPEKELGISNIE